ncbi:MAG: hypothetical protein ACE5EH_04370 [Gammaproteobacteria bacterium]
MSTTNTMLNEDAANGATDGGKTGKAETQTKAKDHIANLHPSLMGRLGVMLFTLMVSFMLYSGWQNREETYLTAEEGLGYALGIIGGSFMLILLLYPARKKFRFMRRLGPVKYWFRTHMMLGILGPLAIIYHCNYQLGSLNSNVALGCMLLVSSSGLIGRYFYTKIHFGLYGRKATLKDLRQDTEVVKGRLETAFSYAPHLHDKLEAIESKALIPASGLLHSAAHLFALGFSSRWTHASLMRFLKRAMKKEEQKSQWSRKERRLHYKEAHTYLADYFDIVRKVAEFKFYERLFALWHVLHFPLFLMMVVSGIVHVFAVHFY